MGFQQGLSGLNAAAKNLDVIGNNVANASTVGFKMSQAQFADVYASSIGVSPGTGTKVATIAQQFSQGNISVTNNPLDLAINGEGFFQIGAGANAEFYTRSGQFQLNKDGFVVTPDGKRLIGKTEPTPATNPQSFVTGAIKIPNANLPANPTANVLANVNLDARNPVTAVAPAAVGAPPLPPAGFMNFSPTDPATYNVSTSTTIYDALGKTHVATMYFQKDSPTATPHNVWNVFLSVDNVIQPGPVNNSVATYTPPAAEPLAKLYFDTTGKYQGSSNATGTAPPVVAAGAAPPAITVPDITVTNASAATSVIQMKLDFNNSTQYGSAFGVNTLSQDGFTDGRPSGFNIDATGTIVGNYTNGQTKTLGYVEIAKFANPQGLQSLGNSRWAVTAASGAAIPGTPQSSSLGSIQSGAVEDANVDLTAELVNMIVAQRVYQANAQSIKTQDAVLQTITNLR